MSSSPPCPLLSAPLVRPSSAPLHQAGCHRSPLGRHRDNECGAWQRREGIVANLPDLLPSTSTSTLVVLQLFSRSDGARRRCKDSSKDDRAATTRSVKEEVRSGSLVWWRGSLTAAVRRCGSGGVQEWRIDGLGGHVGLQFIHSFFFFLFFLFD